MALTANNGGFFARHRWLVWAAGIALAVLLLASFMSGMAGNVTAFNTVWTRDIYEPYIKRDASDAHYLRMGRIATVLGIALAFFPAQQITSLRSYELWMVGGTLFFIGLAAFFFFVYGRRKTARKLAAAAPGI